MTATTADDLFDQDWQRIMQLDPSDPHLDDPGAERPFDDPFESLTGDPFAGQPPWTGAGEVFAAGFLHHEDGPRGAGFAAGGALDQMDAGPLLAWYVANAGGDHRQLAGLGESELIGVMYAAERLISWASGLRAETIIALGLRRAAQSAELKNQHLLEHVDGEIAAALHISRRAATSLLDHSGLLRRLPDVRAAQLKGRITWDKAKIFGDELAGLTGEQAQQVAARVLPEAEGMTPEELRRELYCLVHLTDPGAARDRRKKARKDTAVHLWTEPSGNCGLAGRELDPALARAADARLTAQAQWLAGHGMVGTLDQLRAAAFLANQNGIPLSALLPDADDSDQPDSTTPTSTGSNASNADATRTDGTGSTADSGKPGSGDPDATKPGTSEPPYSTSDAVPITEVPPGPAVTGTINLTMPISAHAYLTDRPGDIAGTGPADADTCRDLARWMARDPATKWCLTLVDPDGRAVAHACAKEAPPTPAPPSTSGSPSTPEPPPAPDRPPRSGKPPNSNGPPDSARPPDSDPPDPPGPPRPPGSPRPSGPRGPSRPPSSVNPSGSADPPRSADPPGPDRPAHSDRLPDSHSGRLIAWLAGLRLEFLERSPCTHQRETPSYRIPRLLRHLLTIRQPTCAEPGCTRPSQHADIDHTIPYDQGGRSCECNTHPVCRHGHRAKQAPGWHLEQPEPGIAVWTLPSGRKYTTRPDTYPT
jgi:hypothetical protein